MIELTDAPKRPLWLSPWMMREVLAAMSRWLDVDRRPRVILTDAEPEPVADPLVGSTVTVRVPERYR